ncbi:deoxyribonuclease [Leptolyngbya valderiana BDU 20041]|nr:TatD family hydrolase [Geitlerinema sp. CS-897]OAB63021.1 deoxyribonuclease [Leptolyngbya valderiana BDU 20041]PPT05525.1 Putative deoxyribonuclease YcfH [Geitlerinema sp. FC II]
MQPIDTHVHINFESFDADLEAVRDRWRAAGVVGLIHSCVRPQEFEKTRAIADLVPEMSWSVGLHPLEARSWSEELAREIADRARSSDRVVAIGETGLDFFKAENRQQQRDAFWGQLQIAQQLNLPVIIHCRDAAEEMVELLRQFWQENGPVGGVMHCWAGTPEQARTFLDLGFYISFSGIVTFKNARSVQESAKIVPEDRLLVETDCPFLAPVPKRGKRNEPAYVRYVVERVAELRGVEAGALAERTAQNAIACFDLEPTVRSRAS